MERAFDTDYPDIPYLEARARQRIPRFAFEYLSGACNSEVNLRANTARIRDVRLQPYYLRGTGAVSLRTTLFGHEYDAPFGIAPIGLQGLMWPRASEILARTAFENNIPYVLSTVGTASIETIAEITEGQAWFQLYNPVADELRADLLQRAHNAGYTTLVVLCDTPSFGYRSREIRNGLSMPPRMTARNIAQIVARPRWALATLIAGQPRFQTLLPYIPKGMNMHHLGLFMNETFSGRLSEDKVQEIRARWPGKLVLKGIVTQEDAEKAVRLGADGIIVSNHGGRQLDCGPATIDSLDALPASLRERITVMMDSGIRSGADVANALATGAQFCFLGRSFMYGVSALGDRGGEQVVEILTRQLRQVMEQVGAEGVEELPGHRVPG
jgi:L-lactate dehydrogenase (cytochrome)